MWIVIKLNAAEIISISPFCKIIRIFAFFYEFSW